MKLATSPAPARWALLGLLATALVGCGSPTNQAGSTATLPASPEARDSVQARLAAPAPDAASTAADSTRTTVTPR